jgi:hypothetical protein
MLHCFQIAVMFVDDLQAAGRDRFGTQVSKAVHSFDFFLLQYWLVFRSMPAHGRCLADGRPAAYNSVFDGHISQFKDSITL